MNIETATKEILEFLKVNLIDPISSRASAWIYDDEARIDLDKTAYPKILLKTNDQEVMKERLAIGSTGTIETAPLIVQIKAKIGEYYGIGQEKWTAREFAAYIGHQAEDLIKQNHDYFIDHGFLHVIPVKEKLSQDSEKNPIFSLTLEMKYISLPEN